MISTLSPSATGAHTPGPNTWSGEAERIAFFFTSPTVEGEKHRVSGESYSTLYLLRREAQDCLIGTVMDEEQVRSFNGSRHRLFATAMVLFAGFDLLGKFCQPNAGPRERFVHFAAHYSYSGDRTAASALYSVRCAMMHTFGLHDDKNQHKLVFAYDPAYSANQATRRITGGWAVDVGQLHSDFVRAHSKYRENLEDNASIYNALRKNFTATFATNGVLCAGTSVAGSQR